MLGVDYFAGTVIVPAVKFRSTPRRAIRKITLDGSSGMLMLAHIPDN
jgi:hypothetical protein